MRKSKIEQPMLIDYLIVGDMKIFYPEEVN